MDLDGPHHLIPASSSAIFMERRQVQFPLETDGGRLSLEKEYVSATNLNETVITWKSLEYGVKTRQWLGFRSQFFLSKEIWFKALIKFVKRLPKVSDKFGLKVCGCFHNELFSRCAADEWCQISAKAYCNGGDYNSVILIFDSVAKKGQEIKMTGVTLTEIGNISF